MTRILTLANFLVKNYFIGRTAMKNAFGKNLKNLRETHNLKQKDLEPILGITRGQVSNYENGVSDPNLDVLIKLAQYFGISLDELILEPGTSLTMAGESPAKYGYASIDEIVKEKDELKAKNQALQDELLDLHREVKAMLKKKL
ncbi:MAG: helix-turn-helix domain-containing protein [Fulvivirga sp.]